MLLGGLRLEVRSHLPRDRDDVHRDAPARHHARVELGDVEQVVDDARQPVDVAGRGAQDLPLLPVDRAGDLIEDEAQPLGRDGERRAQLVRDGADECARQRIQPLQLLVRREQRVLRLLALRDVLQGPREPARVTAGVGKASATLVDVLHPAIPQEQSIVDGVRRALTPRAGIHAFQEGPVFRVDDPDAGHVRGGARSGVQLEEPVELVGPG